MNNHKRASILWLIAALGFFVMGSIKLREGTTYGVFFVLLSLLYFYLFTYRLLNIDIKVLKGIMKDKKTRNVFLLSLFIGFLLIGNLLNYIFN